MTDIVIQAESLGKKYTTGHQAEKGRYVNAKTQRHKDAKLSIFAICHLPPEEIWALKVVSSEIRRGKFEPNYGIMEMMTGIGSRVHGYTVNEIRLQ